MQVDFPVIGFFHVGNLTLDDHALGLDLYLHEGVVARCEIGFELQLLYGGGGEHFVAHGRTPPTAGAIRSPPSELLPLQGFMGW